MYLRKLFLFSFKHSIFILALILCEFLYVLNLYSQSIDSSFPEIVFKEGFDDSSTTAWPIITTPDNLFVFDNGEYYMYRRAASGPYVIIPQWDNTLNGFHLKASLKLGPSETDEQTVGLICNIQSDGKEALVFEFNKSKKYRIKMLSGGFYKLLTGSTNKQGWVRSSDVNGPDEYNNMEVKHYKDTFDFFINGSHLKTLSLNGLGPGKSGIIIGPETKAKSNFYVVNSDSSFVNEIVLNNKDEYAGLTQAQIIRKLKEENEGLKAMITDDSQNPSSDIMKATEILEEQLAEAREEKVKYEMEAGRLKKYEEIIKYSGIDEDVLLMLTMELKQELETNKKLVNEIILLTDSLKSLENYNKDFKLLLLNSVIEQRTEQVEDKLKKEEVKKEQKRHDEEVNENDKSVNQNSNENNTKTNQQEDATREMPDNKQSSEIEKKENNNLPEEDKLKPDSLPVKKAQLREIKENKNE